MFMLHELCSREEGALFFFCVGPFLSEQIPGIGVFPLLLLVFGLNIRFFRRSASEGGKQAHPRSLKLWKPYPSCALGPAKPKAWRITGHGGRFSSSNCRREEEDTVGADDRCCSSIHSRARRARGVRDHEKQCLAMAVWGKVDDADDMTGTAGVAEGRRLKANDTTSHRVYTSYHILFWGKVRVEDGAKSRNEPHGADRWGPGCRLVSGIHQTPRNVHCRSTQLGLSHRSNSGRLCLTIACGASVWHRMMMRWGSVKEKHRGTLASRGRIISDVVPRVTLMFSDLGDS